jgi:GGDEF domain-containing protein
MPKKLKNILDPDRLYSDPSAFKARALEEVRRAKRYATFVSMIALDLTHIDAISDVEKFKSYDDFISSFRKLLRGSIRETDILSIFNGHKAFILLLDTPREGAEVLEERLKIALRYFMAGFIKSPLNWHVPMKEYSFPNGSNDDLGFQAFIDNIDEN